MAQHHFRYSIRVPCGQTDITHDEDCGCRIYGCTAWATDVATAREMADQEAQEMGGERIGTVREEE